VVSYLCSCLENPLVIRFSGGHQAGHHVVINDKLSHVFANFGSGTLQGVDTYWSPYCTVDPVGIMTELAVLKSKGINPMLYVDGKCPVTTPFDKTENITINNQNKHGSCGVGFGQTIQREEDRYSLLFSDIFSKSVFSIKLGLIKDCYYKHLTLGASVFDFMKAAVELRDSKNIKITNGVPNFSLDNDYSNYIFEGSQGLLLDQNIGFFPHVTRSNTGTKNILSMGYDPYVYLVTRAYQTRHGNGPMTNERLTHNIKSNPVEQQVKGGVQGNFRIAPLDLDLLKYGIERDGYINEFPFPFTLVITCMDLIQNSFILTMGGETLHLKDEEAFVNTIKRFLKIGRIAISRTPYFTDIEGMA